MRRGRAIRRTAAVGGLFALLAACATNPSESPAALEPSSPEAATAEDGGPEPTPGLDWHFHQDGAEAKLAYGVANSDDLRLGLTCARGAGEVELSRDAEPDAAPGIRLESGGETETIATRSEPSELSGGVFLTGRIATAHPVMARFRQTGWLAQWVGERREMMAPQPRSRSVIADFLAHCG